MDPTVILEVTGQWLNGSMAPSETFHRGAVYCARSIAEYIHQTQRIPKSANKCPCIICREKKLELIKLEKFQIAHSGEITVEE